LAYLNVWWCTDLQTLNLLTYCQSILCYSILISIVIQYLIYFWTKWFLDPCSTTVSQFSKTLQGSQVLFYETEYSYSAVMQSEYSGYFFNLLYTPCFAVRAFITRLRSSYWKQARYPLSTYIRRLCVSFFRFSTFEIHFFPFYNLTDNITKWWHSKLL